MPSGFWNDTTTGEQKTKAQQFEANIDLMLDKVQP